MPRIYGMGPALLMGVVEGDGNVGPFDLASLLGTWSPCPDPDACPGDLNNDAPWALATWPNSSATGPYAHRSAED